jgi:hypothetical protein
MKRNNKNKVIHNISIPPSAIPKTPVPLMIAIAIPRNHCFDIIATIAIANSTTGRSNHKVNRKVVDKPTIHRMML